MSDPILEVADAPARALASRTPLVALESTVIAHGLPWPENLELARDLERIVREAGATPATIAVLGGALRVGLTDSELERLARDDRVAKLSRRDLPVALAQRLDGATTVAATMLIAHRVGIGVMATGGIGGVHRGAPWDVSADLPELARTPVAVVSSGAKALLDLPATLEWLETAGVPVIGYGTDELPAFYSSSSALPLRARADTPEAAARIVRAGRALGGMGGPLIAVPCPAEEALPNALIEAAIEGALAAAAERGVVGAESTPFLLARIAEATGGRARAANLALLRRNASVAARIAVALAALDGAAA
ncbi:MAG: pseudouridine-5'-phosphate glycosidase [Gemmatimonadales bacterium]